MDISGVILLTYFQIYEREEGDMKKAPHSTTLIKAILPCQRILRCSFDDVMNDYLSPVDDKGRYVHWDDICNKTDNEEKRRAIWSLINLAREHARRPI